MDSMNAAIDTAWRESVEEEVDRRLAELRWYDLAQQGVTGQRQIGEAKDA
jgi:hypothetical protein